MEVLVKTLLAAILMIGLLVSAAATVASAMPASHTTQTYGSSFVGGNG